MRLFKLSLSMVFLSLFCFGKCEKEGEDCHYDYSVVNNSDEIVIVADKAYYGQSNNCQLFGDSVKPKERYTKHSFKSCWEDRLDNSQIVDLYVVDPIQFNEGGMFYDCDSISYKNKILKHYEITLDYLKENDFSLSYPS